MPSDWSQDLYNEAYRFAAQAQWKQNQLVAGTNIPYLMHFSLVAMEIVAALAVESDLDGDLAVQCALLHDTIEDAGISYEELTEKFGYRVADGVAALTKDKSIGGDLSDKWQRNKLQMLDSLKRIKVQPKEIWMVKMADRITNLQPPPYDWTEEKIAKYKEDSIEIYESLKDASPFLAGRLDDKIKSYPQPSEVIKLAPASIINDIKLFNIIDMGLSFSAMIRLYEKDSKRKLREKIIEILNQFFMADHIEFERHHESFCDWGIRNILLAQKIKKDKIIKHSCPATYGQIAKTLDVVLKVVIYYCRYPNPKLAAKLTAFLHAAIDNKMMRYLKKQYPHEFSVWPMSVEAVDKIAYKRLQEIVKKYIRQKHNDRIMPVDFDDLYWYRLNRQKDGNDENDAEKIESIKKKSQTRGGQGKRVSFKWWYDATIDALIIENEKGYKDRFSVSEIVSILQKIEAQFETSYFPLANNIMKLQNGSELKGLGTTILEMQPGNIRHAQAASYLGPVLEQVGYFAWNGKNKGIEWRLNMSDIDETSLRKKLRVV